MLSIYIATSANGFISNSRNVPDWLSSAYGQDFFEVCQRTKAVIMGKTTYNILAPDHLPLQDDGISVVLTSKKNIKPANSTVVFTHDNPHEIVAMLEHKGYREAVIIGGTTVVSDFLNAGLVNEIVMVVEPWLFGEEALPLLRDVKTDNSLKLLDCTRLNSDTVKLHYQIARTA